MKLLVLVCVLVMSVCALVTVVAPGGTAAAMGVRVGDIIVELDGKPISPQVVQEYLQKTKIGDQVTMKVKRGGAVMELAGKAMPAQQ